jgi:hypothetical protein
MGCLIKNLRVYNTIFYNNVFQNPELFPTQVGLSPEQSTLVYGCADKNSVLLSGSCVLSPNYLWPVHLNDKNVSSREDTFLSWHLAPASEVAGGHTLPF